MSFLEPTQDKRPLISQSLWFGIWAAVTLVGAMLKPDSHGHGTHQQLGLPPCPSVLMFNRPCPACGLTTSWTATLHGDFAAAFKAHPLGPLLYLGFTITAFMALYGAIKQLHFRTDTKLANRIATVVGIVFFGFGIYRMATTTNYRSAHEQNYVNVLTGKETAP